MFTLKSMGKSLKRDLSSKRERESRLIAGVSDQFHTRATYVRGRRRGVRCPSDEARSVEEEQRNLATFQAGIPLPRYGLNDSPPSPPLERGWPTNFRIRDTAWISRSLPLLFFPSTKKFSCARKYEPVPPKVNGVDLKWGGMPRDTLNGTSRTGRRYSRCQRSSSRNV